MKTLEFVMSTLTNFSLHERIIAYEIYVGKLGQKDVCRKYNISKAAYYRSFKKSEGLAEILHHTDDVPGEISVEETTFTNLSALRIV